MPKLRLVLIALLAPLIVLQPVWSAAAGDATDPTSSALTSYLHEHRLPAVGAQVTGTADGGRTVILYGFVATPKGKSDAELRTRTYLNDPSVSIMNRIIIDPTLLASNKPNTSNGQIDEYQNYGNPDSSGAGGAGGAPPVAPPSNVGSMQAYQSQNPAIDPMNQNNTLTTGLMILGPVIGGILLYNALSGPSYTPPPSYYYNPPPRSRGHGGGLRHR
jgi:hypothetical protein